MPLVTTVLDVGVVVEVVVVVVVVVVGVVVEVDVDELVDVDVELDVEVELDAVLPVELVLLPLEPCSAASGLESGRPAATALINPAAISAAKATAIRIRCNSEPPPGTPNRVLRVVQAPYAASLARKRTICCI